MHCGTIYHDTSIIIISEPKLHNIAFYKLNITGLMYIFAHNYGFFLFSSDVVLMSHPIVMYCNILYKSKPFTQSQYCVLYNTYFQPTNLTGQAAFQELLYLVQPHWDVSLFVSRHCSVFALYNSI